jgi:uncharacterized membrane protein YdbT with pleckstrin-like domain
MAYIDELLSEDERVLVYSRQHGSVLAAKMFARLITLALLGALLLGVQSRRFVELLSRVPELDFLVSSGLLQPVARYIQIGCLALIALVLLGALLDYLRWSAISYVLTSRRVMSIEGVLNKRAIDSALDKINDVRLEQSWLGRMLNYGDLLVLTASEQGYNALERIVEPLEFKRAMLEARQRLAHKREAPARQEIGAALRSLAALRDQNLLTPEEFEAKKRELLKRL